MDVIVTNLARYYDDPIIIPPIIPDNPGFGAPSDHMGVFAAPSTKSAQINRTKITKKITPLPDSLFPSFESKIKIQLQEFEIRKDIGTSKIVQNFQDTLKALVSSTFPEREIKVYSEDKPYFTEKLRQLKRVIQREYQKHGRSDKYLKIKES